MPTNKRNGLAISRIDEEYCFIRADKTRRDHREERGRGGDRQEERGEESAKEKGKERKKASCLIKWELGADV